jgi:hypothetical protein
MAFRELWGIKAFRMLVAANVAIVAGTAAFLLAAGVTVLNFNIVMSGWTSLGSLVLADYLAVQYFRAQLALRRTRDEVETRLGSDGVDRLVGILARVEERFNSFSPEQRRKMMDMLEKGVNLAMDYLEGMLRNGPGRRRPRRVVVETAEVPSGRNSQAYKPRRSQ